MILILQCILSAVSYLLSRLKICFDVIYSRTLSISIINYESIITLQYKVSHVWTPRYKGHASKAWNHLNVQVFAFTSQFNFEISKVNNNGFCLAKLYFKFEGLRVSRDQEFDISRVNLLCYMYIGGKSELETHFERSRKSRDRSSSHLELPAYEKIYRGRQQTGHSLLWYLRIKRNDTYFGEKGW